MNFGASNERWDLGHTHKDYNTIVSMFVPVSLVLTGQWYVTI